MKRTLLKESIRARKNTTIYLLFNKLYNSFTRRRSIVFALAMCLFTFNYNVKEQLLHA